MNNSTANNDSMYDYNYDYDSSPICNKTEVRKFGSMVTQIFFILVIVFSCVGNTLVLWVLIKFENLKSLTNAFLLNLAISDLVFTFGLPFFVSEHIISGWMIGCKSMNFIFFLGYYSSIIFLTIMTVHRYLVVVHPLSMLINRTVYYSIGISTFIWFLSICAAIPHLIFSNSFKDEDQNYCDTDNVTWKVADVYQQNTFFLISSFTIAFCYFQILCRVLKRASHTRPRTVKLVFCIVIAFYLGWAPYNVAIFLNTLVAWNHTSSIGECHDNTLLEYFIYMSRILAYSHCSLNPLFYVFMGVKYREHLKKVLKSFCQKTDHLPDRPITIYSNEMSTH